ncbi:MAG: hypothetical protein KIT10_01400 [Flavobacteriales bacterium]|nr:hypothetical protein [Flavobacteriales bacterium]
MSEERHTGPEGVFAEAMRAALATLDNAREELAREQQATIAERDALRELRQQAEREGERLAQAWFDERRAQFTRHARYEAILSLAMKHLAAGQREDEVARWLDADANLMAHAAKLVQRRADDRKPLPAPHHATLSYTSQGRGGTVHYRDDRTSFSLWWEFAVEPAVAIIGVPNRAAWENTTGLPVEERDATLGWIAHRALLDQVPGGGLYRVAEDHITLYGGT